MVRIKDRFNTSTVSEANFGTFMCFAISPQFPKSNRITDPYNNINVPKLASLHIPVYQAAAVVSVCNARTQLVNLSLGLTMSFQDINV